MKQKSLTAFLEGIAEKYFTNPDTDKFAFGKLSTQERREVAMQATIHEYVSVMHEKETVTTAISQYDSSQYKAANSFNSIYFDKIRASGGDVTKTPNFANGQILAKYSLGVSTGMKMSGAPIFIEKMQILSDVSDNLVKYRELFVEAIRRELTEPDDQKRIVTQYYTNLVMQLDIGIDVLYSSSIMATIDHSRTPAFVQSVYFTTKKETLADMLTNLHYFNSLAVTGKLKDILSPSGATELKSVKSRLMNENVLDVAFALISTNTVLDLFLIPLYTLRCCVYIVKYLMATYSKMSFAFDRSVSMIRNTNITENEFKSYQSDGAKKALMVDQATRHAAANVSREVADNRQSIKTMADEQAPNNVIM